MDWRDGLLMLIGSQSAQLTQLYGKLDEFSGELQKMQQELDVLKQPRHHHEEEGLGFPGTSSFEDGPEQDVT